MRRPILCLLAASVLVAGPARAATLMVTNLNDVAAGSFRQAALNASPGDTIAFAPGLAGTITNVGTPYDFTFPVTVLGPGAAVLAFSGGDARPLFIVSNGELRISGLTLRNSRDLWGCAISAADTLRVTRCTFRANHSTSAGGAIRATGLLEVTECTFENNVADIPVGGAAISATGAATVRRSTFNGNQGGGIFCSSSLTLESCTLTNNTGSNGGAAVYIAGGANHSIKSCTITGNHGNNGGGVRTDTPVSVGNSILAGNTAATGPDWSGPAVSLGFNVVGNGAGSSGFGNAGSHDQVGSAAATIDPLLAPLADYGGPTWTMAPMPGSVAIDQGTAFGLATDQRGRARGYDVPPVPDMPGGDRSDVGAYELRPSVRTVTTIADAGAGSFRQAVLDLHPYDADSIKFAANVRDTIRLTTGVVTFKGPGVVVGPGSWRLALHGNYAGRVFIVNPNKTVEVDDLMITGGTENEAVAILNLGTLWMSRCRIVNNRNLPSDIPIGGVVRSYPPGELRLERCTIANNETGFGGGVFGGNGYGGGLVTLDNCTVSGNSGPGVVASATTTNIVHSTITNNDYALGYDGGGVWSLQGSVTGLGNTIVADNNKSDIVGGFATIGYNLVGKGDGSTGVVHGVNHDRVGTVAAPLSGGLLALAANGGPGETHALLGTSLAIDHGHAFRPLDQRGAARYDVPSIVNDGDGADIGAFEYNPASTVDVPAPSPELGIALAPARPNPFTDGTTTFASRLDRAGPVTLELFDVAGRKVRTLVATTRLAGAYADAWDGRDDAGRRTAAGVYFARLAAGGGVTTRSVVVLP